jgi:hypothetical protein
MTTVQAIKTPRDIADLLDLRRSLTGFQRAHIVSNDYTRAAREVA